MESVSTRGVTLSSSEAEFVTVIQSGKEVLYLRTLHGPKDKIRFLTTVVVATMCVVWDLANSHVAVVSIA